MVTRELTRLPASMTTSLLSQMLPKPPVKVRIKIQIVTQVTRMRLKTLGMATTIFPNLPIDKKALLSHTRSAVVTSSAIAVDQLRDSMKVHQPLTATFRWTQKTSLSTITPLVEVISRFIKAWSEARVRSVLRILGGNHCCTNKNQSSLP